MSKNPIIDLLASFFKKIFEDEEIRNKAKEFADEKWIKIKLEYSRLSTQIKGKNISIIGAPATGKTTMLRVLKDPNIELERLLEYKKTEIEKHSAFKVKWNIPINVEDPNSQVSFNFKVKACIDNGGEDYIRDSHWLSNIKDADVIFYLIDYQKLKSEESKKNETERIRNDFNWLGGEVNNLKVNFALVLICNKSDIFCKTLNEFRRFKEEEKEYFEKLVLELISDFPVGYQKNFKEPVFLSLLEKKIRNEQFIYLMKAVMGEQMYKLEQESYNIKSNEHGK
jgi:GTPase SAR1 family protein